MVSKEQEIISAIKDLTLEIRLLKCTIAKAYKIKPETRSSYFK